MSQRDGTNFVGIGHLWNCQRRKPFFKIRKKIFAKKLCFWPFWTLFWDFSIPDLSSWVHFWGSDHERTFAWHQILRTLTGIFFLISNPVPVWDRFCPFFGPFWTIWPICWGLGCPIEGSGEGSFWWKLFVTHRLFRFGNRFCRQAGPKVHLGVIGPVALLGSVFRGRLTSSFFTGVPPSVGIHACFFNWTGSEALGPGFVWDRILNPIFCHEFHEFLVFESAWE